MTLKLEVGKTYRDREGEKVRIVNMVAAGKLRYRSSHGYGYGEEGNFRIDKSECSLDLVEECAPDEPVTGASKLPLCEAIKAEIGEAVRAAANFSEQMGLAQAEGIFCKHFDALSVEDLITALCQAQGEDSIYPPAREEKRVKAEAVMQLLRKG